MSLYPLYLIELKNTPKDPKNPVSHETRALLSLFDKYRVCPTRFAEDSRPVRSGLELLELDR